MMNLGSCKSILQDHNYVNIEFNPEEYDIVKVINECETFADVILASEMLYKYCKERKQEEAKTDNHPEQEGQKPSSQDGGETEMNQTNKEHGEDSEQTTGLEEEFEVMVILMLRVLLGRHDIKVETDHSLSSNLKN